MATNEFSIPVDFQKVKNKKACPFSVKKKGKLSISKISLFLCLK